MRISANQENEENVVLPRDSDVRAFYPELVSDLRERGI